MSITEDDSSLGITKIDFSAKVTGGFILVANNCFAYYTHNNSIQEKPQKKAQENLGPLLRRPPGTQLGIRNVSQYDTDFVFILADNERWVFDLTNFSTARLDIEDGGQIEELFYLESREGLSWYFWINSSTTLDLKMERLDTLARRTHTITSDGDYLGGNPSFPVQAILGMKYTDAVLCVLLQQSDIAMWAVFIEVMNDTGNTIQKFKRPLVKQSSTSWYTVEWFWSTGKRNFLVQSGDSELSVYLYRIHKSSLNTITFDHEKQIYPVSRKYESRLYAVARLDQPSGTDTQIMIYGDTGILVTNNLGPASSGLLYFYLTNRIVQRPEPVYGEKRDQVLVVLGGWCYLNGIERQQTNRFQYCAFHPSYRNYTYFGATDDSDYRRIYGIKNREMFILNRGSDSQNTGETWISAIYGNISPHPSFPDESSCGLIPYYNTVYFTKYEAATNEGVTCFFTWTTSGTKNCTSWPILRRKSTNYFWHRYGNF